MQQINQQQSQNDNHKYQSQINDTNDNKKSDKTTIPQLTNQQLFNKIFTDLQKYIDKCKTSYFPQKVKKSVHKMFKINYINLTHHQLQLIVNQLQTFFKQNQSIQSKMSVIRYYHQMIILIDRFRPLISQIIPMMLVQTLQNAKAQNKFFYVRQLKALARMWYGYMDPVFMTRIFDFCSMSCQVNIMDLDLNDKYFARQFKNIRFDRFITQKIIAGNSTGFYGFGGMMYQPPPQSWKPKFNNHKKHRQQKEDKMSNYSNGSGDMNESINGNEHVGEQFPASIETTQLNDELNNKIKSKQNINQLSSKQILNEQIKKSIKDNIIQISNSKLSIQKNNQIKNTIKQSNNQIQQNKQSKSVKLKQMYKLMLLKKKRKGSKFLAQSGYWQLSLELTQIFKEITYQKEIQRIVNEQIEQEDQQWIYPENKLDKSINQHPFQFICKFCNKKLQEYQDHNQKYYKNIVLFEIRREGKRYLNDIPCFRSNSTEQHREGLFLLHQECFKVLQDRNFQEKNWILQ